MTVLLDCLLKKCRLGKSFLSEATSGKRDDESVLTVGMA
jgi:hypothetical protein